MNMAATAKKTRVRKANFSVEEISLMLQEIATEKGILLSQLTNEATNRRKNAIWSAIASKVTACGVAVWTDEEVCDKWKNVKSEVIRRINDQKKTGVALRKSRSRMKSW